MNHRILPVNPSFLLQVSHEQRFRFFFSAVGESIGTVARKTEKFLFFQIFCGYLLSVDAASTGDSFFMVGVTACSR